MRAHMTADWAFGIRGAIENVVRANFPSDLRNWPLIQIFDFEAYVINNQYMVMILKDKLAGIPSGPGEPKPFPYSDHPSIPPQVDDVELWQSYLRNKFSIKEEDAAFMFPIKDSGKNSATEDYKLFSDDEKLFWDHQIKYVVTRHKAYLQPKAETLPSSPTNITYNIRGTGARVYINSLDSSVNIIKQEATEIFDQLRSLLNQIEDEKNRTSISNAIDEMEKTHGTNNFLSKYQQFMSLIADHITVFAPILTTLSGLLT